MTSLYLFVALVTLGYLWSLSVKRQVTRHYQHHQRRVSAQRATFYKPHTPSNGVTARH